MRNGLVIRHRQQSEEVTKKHIHGSNVDIAADIGGIDLFCGAGGLTRGLEIAGIDVRLGIDVDTACEYPYSANNNAKFLLKSVEEVSPADLSEAFGSARFRLLAGCAPCQPPTSAGTY